jgi:predicted SAM-dependent methyltransferase
MTRRVRAHCATAGGAAIAVAPRPGMARGGKLYLGCGERRIPGFVHVDPDPEADVSTEIHDLSAFADGSMALIYASHVLERYGRYEVFDVISEWFRVLRPGGILRLAGPDFAKAARHYLERGDIRDVIGLVVGGQGVDGDYHRALFDEESLGELLLDVGFRSVDRYDWRRTEHAATDDQSQAYLPHMDKAGGTLVSLNIEAVK